MAAASANDIFFVKLELAGEGIAADQASFVLRVVPSWAPLGAARFRELVESKFYDDQRFFRVLDGMYDIWIAQFGISGNPEIQKEWESKGGLRDDEIKHSNTRGTVSFAMAGPNTRTTQLFLNFGDCSKVLDSDFAPFAEVVSGMEAVDLIFKIGEGAPSGKGPSQGKINQMGNTYLDKEFPMLTKIVSARVVAHSEL
jgi:peptidyl-prolyl cis-trans isomerase A (cyclophilin A)